MTGFVDATDPSAVADVLALLLRVIGPDAVAEQLSGVLQVTPGRPGGVFRSATPAVVAYGDQSVTLAPRGAVLHHVVGGVRLSSDAVAPTALPGVLAGLVARAVNDSGRADDVAVLLTSLRDAAEAAG